MVDPGVDAFAVYADALSAISIGAELLAVFVFRDIGGAFDGSCWRGEAETCAGANSVYNDSAEPRGADADSTNDRFIFEDFLALDGWCVCRLGGR